MKKFVCLMLCLLCLTSASGCRHEEVSAPRVWCVAPSSAGAETEVFQMLRQFDSGIFVSFVPEEELDMRLAAAAKKGELPDVFMMHADAIPDLAEEKKLCELDNRLRVGHVKADELFDAARRACVYQGKTWGIPLFADVYMLATDRALVSAPPDTVSGLADTVARLRDVSVSSFGRLTPEKRTLLFECVLKHEGGQMLNARKTRLAFASEQGERALSVFTELMQQASDEMFAFGNGEAAFSVLSLYERRVLAEKFPDAEIALSPLFGIDRLQTISIAVSEKSKDQKRAFAIAEFMHGKADELSVLYQRYAASKALTPMAEEDAEAVLRLARAQPAPDLCGYAALCGTYLPAAFDKAKSGVPVSDALDEAAEQASPNIWKGKRE